MGLFNMPLGQGFRALGVADDVTLFGSVSKAALMGGVSLPPFGWGTRAVAHIAICVWP